MSVGTRRGLTLVEVVVAVAILGFTVATAASVFGQASHLRVTTQRDDDARVAVENETERLRALPYWTGGDGSTQQDGSLVGAVFPHALTGRNTESRYVVSGDGQDTPAGAFVTLGALGDRGLRVVARFAVSSRDGWRALDWAAIQGFACEEAWRPPGTTMLVAVAVLASAAGESSVLFEQYSVIAARQSPITALAAARATSEPGR